MRTLFIGKCSENGPLGFGERGRVGDFVGGGVCLNLPSSLAPSFDTTGRSASDSMYVRGRHPQG